VSCGGDTAAEGVSIDSGIRVVSYLPGCNALKAVFTTRRLEVIS
jgi:hypothetical protein